MASNGLLDPKPGTTLGECLEMELHQFSNNYYFIDLQTYSPVLCFSFASNAAECKYIRYFASFYDFITIYLGPKENRRVCVLKKTCLRPQFREKFSSYFSTDDEDTEPAMTAHINYKLADVALSKHRRTVQQQNGNQQSTSHGPLYGHTVSGSQDAYYDGDFGSGLNAVPFGRTIYENGLISSVPVCTENTSTPFADIDYNLYPYNSSGINEYTYIPNNLPYTMHMYHTETVPQLDDSNTISIPYNAAEIEYGAYMMQNPDDTAMNTNYYLASEETYTQTVDGTSEMIASNWQMQSVDHSNEQLASEQVANNEIDPIAICDKSFNKLTINDSNVHGIDQLPNIEYETGKGTNIPYFALNVPGLPMVDPSNVTNVDEESIEKILEYVEHPLIVCPAFNCETLRSEFKLESDYVIELYGFPKAVSTRNLLNIYREEPRFIKWCDDQHALLVTSSKNQAIRSLAIEHPGLQSRPIAKASPIATVFVCRTKLCTLFPKSNHCKYQKTNNTTVIINVKQKDTVFNGFGDLKQRVILTNCHSLILNDCDITKMEHLEGLVNLRELNLSFNKIKVLEGLTNLGNLEILTLNNNYIGKIENLNTVPKLDVLAICYNKLTKIQNLEYVDQLRVLELKGNRINAIENLTVLRNLVWLNLSDNFITSAKGLNNFSDLKYLNLNRNQLTTINGIGGLMKLNILYLNFNRLEDWLEFKELEKRQCVVLHWKGNPFTKNY